jgi:hypothetical protein
MKKLLLMLIITSVFSARVSVVSACGLLSHEIQVENESSRKMKFTVHRVAGGTRSKDVEPKGTSSICQGLYCTTKVDVEDIDETKDPDTGEILKYRPRGPQSRLEVPLKGRKASIRIPAGTAERCASHYLRIYDYGNDLNVGHQE